LDCSVSSDIFNSKGLNGKGRFKALKDVLKLAKSFRLEDIYGKI